MPGLWSTMLDGLEGEQVPRATLQGVSSYPVGVGAGSFQRKEEYKELK